VHIQNARRLGEGIKQGFSLDHPKSAMNRILRPQDGWLSSRSINELANAVFSVLRGSVIALGGVTLEQVQLALENADPGQDSRLALFVPIEQATSAEQIVELIAEHLAKTAERLWPMWFTDVNFGSCRNDALGRQAARIMAREVARKSPTIFLSWAEAAVTCALAGRKPRVDDLNVAVEIEQLCFAINLQGLILIIDAEAAKAPADAFVHALEWIGQKAGAAVVVLFPELPDTAPPFDRILHGAVQVLTPLGSMTPAEGEATTDWPWLAPVRGIPHPLSETEQRLAKALARDGELAPLFCFNQLIETVHGSRPKVDLVWTAGRLVVELDGYADHGTRTAFMHDRHRDYQLTLSGYTVIRLANDEITQDIEKAVEKIRDVVQLCRARIG
jgi:very-short-patch-repair endonuclease